MNKADTAFILAFAALVNVTPTAGFVGPNAAIIVGLLGGAVWLS